MAIWNKTFLIYQEVNKGNTLSEKFFAFGNQNSQIGNEINPPQINLVSNLDGIYGGKSHTIFLCEKTKEDGKIFVSGLNHKGQLGLDFQKDFKLHSLELEHLEIKMISCGKNHSIFVSYLNDGMVFVCGSNKFGQCGIKNEKNIIYSLCKIDPKKLESEHKGIREIISGANHTFILKKDGSVFVFGDNRKGQIGLQEVQIQYEPELLMIKKQIKSISCGYNHSIILTYESEVFACGDNSFGQCGFGESQGEKTFKSLISPKNFFSNVPKDEKEEKKYYLNKLLMDSYYMGIEEEMIHKLNENNFGEEKLNPVEIKKICCGGYHSMFLIEDGVIVTGSNEYGQLIGKTDTITKISIPILLKQEAKISDISCGLNHSLFLTKKGKVKAIGDNSLKQYDNPIFNKKEDEEIFENEDDESVEIELVQHKFKRPRKYLLGFLGQPQTHLNKSLRNACILNDFIKSDLAILKGATNFDECLHCLKILGYPKLEEKILSIQKIYKNTTDNFSSDEIQMNEFVFVFPSNQGILRFFKGGMRLGKPVGRGVLTENHKQVFVEFDDFGKIKHTEKIFDGMRLMLVGVKNVGKTTVKERILGCNDTKKNHEAYRKANVVKKEENMTHGIEIVIWEDKKSNILFSIWDFAGHEEYHISHSFFFTSGCIYLLLFDMSVSLDKIVSENKLNYWFSFLHNHIHEKGYVVLIGTKFDLFSKKVQSSDVWNKLLQINDEIKSHTKHLKLNFYSDGELIFHYLDNLREDTKQNGIFKLTQFLKLRFQNIEYSFDANYDHKIIYDNIKKMAENQEFCDIIPVEKLFNEEFKKTLNKTETNYLEYILQDLHNVGLIVYFHEDLVLKNYIISHPKFFNDIFKSVLDFGKKKLFSFLRKLCKHMKELNNNKKGSFFFKKKSITEAEKLLFRLSGNSRVNLEDEYHSDEEINLCLFSFEFILDSISNLQKMMKEDDLENEFQHVFSSFFLTFSKKKIFDLNQSIFKIDPLEFIEILGEIVKTRVKEKIEFVRNVLIRYDFFLTVVDTQNNTFNYLVPLLFPKFYKDDLFYKLEKKKRDNEWNIKYFLPFKPHAMWRSLFMKIRTICSETEILKEFYWIDSFFLIFSNEIIQNQRSNILHLKTQEASLIYNNEINPSGTISVMEIIFKSDDENFVVPLFNKIDRSVQTFFSNFMKISFPIPFYFSKTFSLTENLNQKSSKFLTRCLKCKQMTSFDLQTKNCEICMTEEFLFHKNFTIEKLIKEGGQGKLYKGKYKNIHGVAIKQRLNDNDIILRAWNNEIQIHGFIQKEIPFLTTASLLCTIDDNPKKNDQKYIILEWIDGSSFKSLHSIFLEKFFTSEKDLIRLFLILLNELNILHSIDLIHRDITPDNIMWFVKENVLHFCFIDFGVSYRLNFTKKKINLIQDNYKPNEKKNHS